MICAAAYVHGRVRALVRKCWQPAAAAVEPVETGTEKDVTGGDAPEDVGAASNARRNTVCIYIFTYIHTCIVVAAASVYI
jgi:hypothetical protein